MAILIEILGSAKQFKAELDSAVASTAKANTGFSKLGKAAGIAGLAIAGGLAVGLDKSVKAAAAAQTATLKLDQAFQNSGISAAAVEPKVAALESANRKLGFANDDTTASLTKLVTAGESVKRATTDMGVAVDLARYKNIDLTDATSALIKVHAGNARALKELGIVLPPVTAAQDALKQATKDTTTEAYKHALALAKVQDKLATGAAAAQVLADKVRGQGAAFSESAQGGMAQMHAQLNAVEISLGQALLPALTSVSASLASFTGFMSQHTTVVKIAIVALGLLAAGLLAVSIATKVVAAAQAVMTAAQWALNVAMTANPIGVVVVALAALAAAFYVAWTHSKTFRDIVLADLYRGQRLVEKVYPDPQNS